MNAAELLKERTELFDNVYNFQYNKRTPLLSNYWAWMVLDSLEPNSRKLGETLRNYNKLSAANESFHQRYQFDAYQNLSFRNIPRVTDILGGGNHMVDEKMESIVVKDHHYMEANEYSELIANPMAFYWEKVFRRFCKPDITVGEITNALMEFAAFGQYQQGELSRFLTKHGAMGTGAVNIFPPYEYLFNIFRGIKGVSMDLRRNKSALLEALEAMDKAFGCRAAIAQSLQPDVDHTGFFADFQFVMLGHSILNAKQFEEVYWPWLKYALDLAVQNKKRVFIFAEATILRFAEFFEDIPKGVLMMQLEQDNIFEFRKRLPNIAIAGGMPVELLGEGTKEQCIDYAKKLIDELGPGYALSSDKMVSYRRDTKRENLIAVNDFVRSYTP